MEQVVGDVDAAQSFTHRIGLTGIPGDHVDVGEPRQVAQPDQDVGNERTLYPAAINPAPTGHRCWPVAPVTRTVPRVGSHRRGAAGVFTESGSTPAGLDCDGASASMVPGDPAADAHASRHPVRWVPSDGAGASEQVFSAAKVGVVAEVSPMRSSVARSSSGPSWATSTRESPSAVCFAPCTPLRRI